MRNIPFGQDGDVSENSLIDRHNNELANKLGNLISRTSALAEKYGLTKSSIKNLNSKHLQNQFEKHMENLEFDKALNEIFSFIDECNEFIQKNKIWETKDKKQLYELSNAIKDFSILIYPFLPETSEKIAKNFKFDISLNSLKSPLKISKIKKAPILFQKIEQNNKVITKNNNLKKQDEKSIKTNEEPELKIGKILNVKDHPNADKLYIFEVDFGN